MSDEAAFLIAIVKQDAELFRAADGSCFADIRVNGHRETWPIRSQGFEDWWARRYYDLTMSAPGSDAIRNARRVIEACARSDAPTRNVNLRIGGLDGRVYLDLCDDAWRAVEIDDNDWRVIDEPPVRFRRAAGMLPLPEPVKGGSVERLRDFINVPSDDPWTLLVSYLQGCFQPRGPYPVLQVVGEEGSAKTTATKVLHALIDPNAVQSRALPSTARDLFIAANNSFMLEFGNVSSIPPLLSDALCELATGGSFRTRQLYSDTGETLIYAVRPTMINGIANVIDRPDLAERALTIAVKAIRDENRRTETELWAAFEAERPAILGGLLDTVVHGLKQLPHTRLQRLPRMADFAHFATACETALWQAGTFEKAYRRNRYAATEDMIDADPVASGVRDLHERQPEWSGSNMSATAS